MIYTFPTYIPALDCIEAMAFALPHERVEHCLRTIEQLLGAEGIAGSGVTWSTRLTSWMTGPPHGQPPSNDQQPTAQQLSDDLSG